MARGSSTNYIDLSGGVNPNAGPYLLAENQAKDARNFHTTPIGSLRKREGFSSLATPATLESVHSLAPVNTATKSLLAVGKQASASADRIITLSTGGTPTTLKSGLTQGKRWEWAQAPINDTPTPDQGPMYGLNGTDTPQYWDGSASATGDWTADTGTVPSSCRFLIYHSDRLWATGSLTTALTGRVFYSGLSADAVPGPDPGNWDTDNYVDIEPQDGENITGIGKVGPYLVVFKPRATYVITDPVTGAWRQISNEIGCCAHRSIVETDQGTFFLSEDAGVCRTDGSKVERISDDITPFLRTAADDNPTTLPYAAATLFRNSYYLSIPYGGSTNDLTLEYDLLSESWWPHTIASNQFALLDPVGSPKLYSADPSAVRVSRAFVPDTYQDNGSDYDTYYISSYQTWGEPHLNKRVTQFRIDGSGTWLLSGAKTFDADYENFDGEALEQTDEGVTFGQVGETFGGSGTFAPEAGVTQWSYPTPGVGRAWSLRIDNTDSRACEIFSLAAFVRQRAD